MTKALSLLETTWLNALNHIRKQNKDRKIPYDTEPIRILTERNLYHPRALPLFYFEDLPRDPLFIWNQTDPTKIFHLTEWLLEQSPRQLKEIMGALGLGNLPFDLETYLIILERLVSSGDTMIEDSEVKKWLCILSREELLDVTYHPNAPRHGELLWYALTGKVYHAFRLPGEFDRLTALALIRGKAYDPNVPHMWYWDHERRSEHFKQWEDTLRWSRVTCMRVLLQRTNQEWSQKVAREIDKVLGIPPLSNIIGSYTPGNVDELAVLVGMLFPDHVQTYEQKEYYFLANLDYYQYLIEHEGPFGCPTGGREKCHCVGTKLIYRQVSPPVGQDFNCDKERAWFLENPEKCTDLELLTRFPLIPNAVEYFNSFLRGTPEATVYIIPLIKRNWRSRGELLRAVNFLMEEESAESGGFEEE